MLFHFIKKSKIYAIGFLSLIIFSTLISYAAILPVAIIKFYSEGKLITQWNAIDKGRVDGNCYIFHISKGATRPEVRVCGSYSVEQLR
ncbi:MAG: hypothetical protein ACC657_13865 [Thiohalomonadales bacterium]